MSKRVYLKGSRAGDDDEHDGHDDAGESGQRGEDDGGAGREDLRRHGGPNPIVRRQSQVFGRLHGGPNDSGIDSLSTGPLAHPFACSRAPLTRSLVPDCSLCSRLPLRSLVRSLAHFAHSLARGKVSF